MKRTTSILGVALLVLAVAAPASAGDHGEQVELAGWITDSYCGKANANAEGKDCTIACADNGAQLVLYANDKIFKLSDQQGAREHVGHEVVVRGTLREDGTIRVTKFEKKEA